MAYFAAADTALASLEARVAALEAAAVTPGGTGTGDPFPPEGGINAMSYCHGDGTTDDTAHILSAIAAAAGAPVYVPAGTYRLASTLVVPDGTKLVGEGMTSAWLQGQVAFGSYSTFQDLKIGPASAGVAGLKNVDGANGTSFTRCHFRGGGAASDSSNSSTVNLGDGRDLSNLTFIDCEFERSLGTSWSGASDWTHRENTVSLYAGGCTIDTVTFRRCHFGVSNGGAAGASRMMVEAYTFADAQKRWWWKNLTFTDCEFEASNVHTLDFACGGNGAQGDGVLVEDCLFHGAGVDEKDTAWGQGICLEWPKNIVIRNNTFYRCAESGIQPSYHSAFAADNNLTVTGNVFNFDTAEGGIPATNASCAAFHGANGTITNNTFTYHGDDFIGCVWFTGSYATGNTVTGNTFNVSETQTICRNTGGAADNGEPWTATNTVNRS